jgi:predicted dehydrogenase
MQLNIKNIKRMSSMDKKIYRIGIIGSDSSHAEVFSRLINITEAENEESLFPDCKVTAIYGHDEQRTKAVAEKAQIEFIAPNTEEIMDKVDAVMVVFRDGNLHAQYALPFIKAGIPVWIDKPFTIKDEDAEEIVNTAKQFNILITGGSTCKYAEQILKAKDIINNDNSIGKVMSAEISFNASFNDPYGGIYFYGSHLLEMALQVFGYNPKTVMSARSEETVVSILKYDGYEVVLNFIDKLDKGSLIIHGTKDVFNCQIDISNVYRQGLTRFIEMLRTRQAPFPIENMLATVKVFNSIVKSLETRGEIEI